MATSKRSCAFPGGCSSPPQLFRQESRESWKFQNAGDQKNIPSLAEEATQQSMKEVALVDALKASQEANEALEAVVKMQAEAMEKIMLEREKEREYLQQLMRKYKSSQVATPKVPELLDVAVQTVSEEDKETSQPTPKIQPPVVPPTPSLSHGQAPLGSPRVQVPAPPPNPRIQPPFATPTPENVEGTQQSIADLNMANASPHVAEAFRLGWLAGVKSNTMAANRSPSSTRSDESPPSDPGSFINVSTSNEASDSDSGSATPPLPAPPRASDSDSGSVKLVIQPGGVLPPLPALLPPPPPPMLCSPPETPVLDIEQLG